MAARIAKRRADLDGRGIAYAESGGEPPLLLIHGFPLDHWMWRSQIGTFGEIRRVIAPDLFGFGDSGGTGHDSLDAHADDLADLLTSLAIPQAVVAGFSMGGYVAFAFWRRHADRVAGLVLADTKAGADTEARHESERAALAKRQAELDRERRKLEVDQARERDKLDRKVAVARNKYDRAMQAWRDD